jgi:hypothetical protein
VGRARDLTRDELGMLLTLSREPRHPDTAGHNDDDEDSE